MSPFVKIGAGFVTVVVAATLLIVWLSFGEDQGLRDLYRAMLQHARVYEPDGILSVFVEKYDYNGRDFVSLTRLVRANITKERYASLEERSLKILLEKPNSGIIDCEILVRRTEYGRSFSVPVRVVLRAFKWEGRWYVSGVDYEVLSR